MVNLGFKLLTKGSISKVWDYFSRFETIEQWDPNVKSAKVVKQSPGKLGTVYELVTSINGNESTIPYTLVRYEQNKVIGVRGENNMFIAQDEIIFRELGEGTEIHYRSQMSLKSFYWLLTPFIKGELMKLAGVVEEGMRVKCEELFGK